MALAWKAGWVNSPQGFESPILRHRNGAGPQGPAPFRVPGPGTASCKLRGRVVGGRVVSASETQRAAHCPAWVWSRYVQAPERLPHSTNEGAVIGCGAVVGGRARRRAGGRERR